MKREDCAHEILFFGSGDYYLFCRGCGAAWMTKAMDSRAEYGHDGVGRDVGAVPEFSNKGKGVGLTGQERIAPAPKRHGQRSKE